MQLHQHQSVTFKSENYNLPCFRMKTSRAVARSSVQSEGDCGVWLDTVKLKGKVQKKRSARPISKLLNPFTDGAGYNVAVALNFTQTKIAMPRTKQSSISNFFTCQRRVLNKMSTSGRQSEGSEEACSSTTTTGYYDKDFNTEPQWSNVDYNQEKNTQQTEPQAAMWWETEDEECNLSSLQNIHSDYKEESSLDSSEFMNKNNLPSNTCDFRHESSQDPLHFNHESNFLTTQNGFGGLFNAEGRTSTQKTFNEQSLQNDKENMTSKYPKMPKFDSHIQMLSRQTKLKQLQKHISLKTCTQDQNEGLNSPIKWTKPKNSPIKNQKCQFRDSDDESLTMLFTQDSQGFRVIAHRGLQTRSPLKDQSNLSVYVPSAVKSLEEDDDEEMLFTQDSQGNVVIKH